MNLKLKVNCLSNKNILVTGASSGSGRIIAKALAKYGATVILSGRNISALTTLYDEILAAKYQTPIIYPLNLATANADHYAQMLSDLTHSFNKLDGILHNAATIGSLGPLTEYSIEQWYQVWQVNFNSRFLLTKYLMPLLQKAETASILLIAPNPEEYSKAFWGPYSITASANKQLCYIWAKELQNISNIRFNMLCPPPMKTTMRHKAFPAEDTSQLIKPEQLINYYIYFLSDNSKDTTAKIININIDSKINTQDI